MRALALCLGLAVGLALAVLVFAEIGHLRRLAGDALPRWTDTIQPGSGLLAGSALVPATTAHSAVEVTWRDPGWDAAGPAWSLRASASGLDAQARARPGPEARLITITDGTARFTLDALTQRPGTPELNGAVQISGIDANVDIQARRVDRLTATGRLDALRLAGLRLGDGDLQVSVDLSGSWRVRFDLAGADLSAVGRIVTVPGQRLLRIEATATGGPDLPEDWRRRLDAAYGPAQGTDSWRIMAEIAF